MNTDKVIYWVTTGIICAMMLFSAYGYFTSEQMKGAFVHLGFPSYFREELGTAKILGVLALLIPAVPTKLKEFAYFGFALVFISAIIAHLSTGDGVGGAVMPLVFLGILGVSYIYKDKMA